MTESPVAIRPTGRESTSLAGYSPAVAVERAGLLFVAGHTGLDPEGKSIADPEAQFTALFDRMGEVLVEAGVGFETLVEMTSYHVSFETLEVFMTVKARYLTGGVAPAWTAVGVTALGVPGALVEVRATAVLGS